MGASCSSSRSSTSAVLITTTHDLSTPTTARNANASSTASATTSRTRAIHSATFNSTAASPLIRYLADLEPNTIDVGLYDFSRNYRHRRHPHYRLGAPHGYHYRRSREMRGTRDEEEEAGRQLHDVAALQESLAAMEDFFQSLLGQAHIYMEAMDPNAGGRGPPPASSDVLTHLDKVKVTEAILEDRNDKCCEICCEEHEVGSEVTRLPCGHIYHGPCIETWLNRHCTCPVCRYELATEDASYEPGRLERMRDRKLPARASSEETTE